MKRKGTKGVKKNGGKLRDRQVYVEGTGLSSFELVYMRNATDPHNALKSPQPPILLPMGRW